MIVDGGYCDLQINGGYGVDLSTAPESMWELGARLPAHGVTAFLPTLISSGFGELHRALDALAGGPPDDWVGARPLGLHLEGPWLAADRRGAHDRNALRAVDSPIDERIAADDGVALVTVAPEIDGGIELITELVRRGIAVSIGHTGATPERCRRAFTAGATMGTHLFNAMGGLHHRTPGAAAALLLDDEVHVGLIADGHHVAPEMVDLAWRLAAERIVLVSDAVTFLGRTAEPVARLADGTLAGSVIGLDRAVANLCAFTGCPLEEAAGAASTTPRRVLGVDALAGDATEIDDDGRVIRTWIGGSLVWER